MLSVEEARARIAAHHYRSMGRTSISVFQSEGKMPLLQTGTHPSAGCIVKVMRTSLSNMRKMMFGISERNMLITCKMKHLMMLNEGSL